MGEEVADCFEGVDSFKYLGRFLHRTDDNWPAVFRTIWRARQVWGRLGKLLRREGGSGPDHLRKFLPRSVTGGATIWVGNRVLTAAML